VVYGETLRNHPIRGRTNSRIRRIPGYDSAGHVWRVRAARKMFSGRLSITGINAVTVVT
jgi:hypothetical protein